MKNSAIDIDLVELREYIEDLEVRNEQLVGKLEELKAQKADGLFFIKITKAEPRFWYYDRIGERFLAREWNGYYQIVDWITGSAIGTVSKDNAVRL